MGERKGIRNPTRNLFFFHLFCNQEINFKVLLLGFLIQKLMVQAVQLRTAFFLSLNETILQGRMLDQTF